MKIEFKKSLVILCFTLMNTLTGCVGALKSFPTPAQIRQIPIGNANFDDAKYEPREALEGEKITRVTSRREIIYSTVDGQNECLDFLLFLPIPLPGNCSRIETWSYQDGPLVTVTTHSHRVFGMVCSPIPYVASFWESGIGWGRPIDLNLRQYLPFCTLHLGSEYYKTGSYFPF